MSSGKGKPDNNITYDGIYFGGGAAGRFGAAYLQALGGKVMIVEREGLGGECHKCRCAFENFLSDQASMAEIMRTCSGLAWYPEVDASKFEHHKACQVYREIGQRAFHDAMSHQTELQLEIPVAWGEGKIIDQNTVEVDGTVYKTKNLIIATGSRPAIPRDGIAAIPGTNLENVWTYLDHPNLTWDPKKLVIIGGGKIGIGKAAMFAPFGIDVTVLQRSTIIKHWDWEVRNWIYGDFKRRNIKIHEWCNVKTIKGNGKVEAVVAKMQDGTTQEFPCDAVMLATDLTPNSEVAEPLGVKIGSYNQIITNKKCQTSVPNVYAVGDVSGFPYLMAVARKEGMIAAKNIMGEEAEWDDTLPLPDHMYVPPMEATCVGLTEDEAREQYGDDLVVIRVPWGDLGKDPEPLKYIEHLENQALPVCGRMHSQNLYFHGENRNGMMKALVDPKTRKYVGFHSVGDGAKTAFQYLSYLLKIGWTIDQMANLHEIFLNAEHFVQLSRLVAGQKQLKGYSAQVVTQKYN